MRVLGRVLSSQDCSSLSYAPHRLPLPLVFKIKRVLGDETIMREGEAGLAMDGARL